QGHLEPVENPGDAEGEHHAGVKAAPGQRIQPRRDRGLDQAIATTPRNWRDLIFDDGGLLEGHRIKPMQKRPRNTTPRGSIARTATRLCLPRRDNALAMLGFRRRIWNGAAVVRFSL